MSSMTAKPAAPCYAKYSPKTQQNTGKISNSPQITQNPHLSILTSEGFGIGAYRYVVVSRSSLQTRSH